MGELKAVAGPAIILTITPVDAGGGHGAATALTIPIPTVLSLRVAKLHAIEQIMKQMKAAGLGDALKAIGCK